MKVTILLQLTFTSQFIANTPLKTIHECFFTNWNKLSACMFISHCIFLHWLFYINQSIDTTDHFSSEIK